MESLDRSSFLMDFFPDCNKVQCEDVTRSKMMSMTLLYRKMMLINRKILCFWCVNAV